MPNKSISLKQPQESSLFWNIFEYSGIAGGWAAAISVVVQAVLDLRGFDLGGYVPGLAFIIVFVIVLIVYGLIRSRRDAIQYRDEAKRDLERAQVLRESVDLEYTKDMKEAFEQLRSSVRKSNGHIDIVKFSSGTKREEADYRRAIVDRIGIQNPIENVRRITRSYNKDSNFILELLERTKDEGIYDKIQLFEMPENMYFPIDYVIIDEEILFIFFHDSRGSKDVYSCITTENSYIIKEFTNSFNLLRDECDNGEYIRGENQCKRIIKDIKAGVNQE